MGNKKKSKKEKVEESKVEEAKEEEASFEESEEVKEAEEIPKVEENTANEVQQQSVSSTVVEESLYLSSIGTESMVQMQEINIPGTLTETQVSLPVDNSSGGSDKEPEVVQQVEVIQQLEIPSHDLHVPAAQIPKIIEEEDDSLS